ncbi:MAG: hypothetical protein ACK5NG_05325, partial [Chthoniobacterales bacterium]
LVFLVLLHSVVRFFSLCSAQKTAIWADRNFAISDRMSLLVQLAKEIPDAPFNRRTELHAAARQETLYFFEKNYRALRYSPRSCFCHWPFAAILVSAGLLFIFFSLHSQPLGSASSVAESGGWIRKQAEVTQAEIKKSGLDKTSEKKFKALVHDWQKKYFKLPHTSQSRTEFQHEAHLRLQGALQAELQRQKLALTASALPLSQEALRALAQAAELPDFQKALSQGQLQKAAKILEANFSPGEQQQLLEKALAKTSSESAAAQLAKMLRRQQKNTSPSKITDSSASLSGSQQLLAQSRHENQKAALERLSKAFQEMNSTLSPADTKPEEQSPAALSSSSKISEPGKTLSSEEVNTTTEINPPDTLQATQLIQLESLLAKGESIESIIFSSTNQKDPAATRSTNARDLSKLLRDNLARNPELQSGSTNHYLRPEQRKLIRNYFDSLPRP